MIRIRPWRTDPSGAELPVGVASGAGDLAACIELKMRRHNAKNSSAHEPLTALTGLRLFRFSAGDSILPQHSSESRSPGQGTRVGEQRQESPSAIFPQKA